MQKFLKGNLSLILVIFFSLLISWPVFMPGYFTHHDDIQVMRIFEMRKCFEDLQIPCRWVSDMGYGYGFPLFNYYSALPYYIGAVFSYVFGFVGAAKVIFFIPLVIAGITMYYLGRRLFGDFAGLVASVVYIFAPYRALDIYVRGAVAESFAIGLAPLMFYFSHKHIVEKDRKSFVFFAFSVGAFLITHNIMTLMFIPLLLVWIIYWLYKEKFGGLKSIFVSFILGVGLASFFLMPAFLEKELVRVDTLTRYDLDFRVHFVTVGQLFTNRDWGYGASVLGPNDTISFQIGWPHWMLVLGLVVLLAFKFRRNKFKELLLPVIFIFSFGLSIFMTHNKSAFIWEQIGLLRFVQFPWRFLSITIFCVSILAGFLLMDLKKNWVKPVGILVIGLTVILNFSFFKPDRIYPLSDNEKLSGTNWEEQRKAALFDYLPKGLIEPTKAAPNGPQIVEGSGQVGNFVNKSNKWSFDINSQGSTVEVPVFDFPNWKVSINGQVVNHQKNERSGVIKVTVPAGEHLIQGKFENTLVRNMANVFTVLSATALILLFLNYGKAGKFFK